MIHMRLTGRWETAEELWMISHLFNCYWLYYIILAGPLPQGISSAVNACANALQWQHALRLLKKPPVPWHLQHLTGYPASQVVEAEINRFFALATSTCKCFLSYVPCAPIFWCDMPKGAGKPCICWWTPQFWQQNVQYHQHHQHHPNDSDQFWSYAFMFHHFPIFPPYLLFSPWKAQDFYSYSASINACARCQRWSHALALASFLSEQRQPPNGIMWGAIVGVMPRGQAPSGHLRGTRRSVTPWPVQVVMGEENHGKWWKDMVLGKLWLNHGDWMRFICLEGTRNTAVGRIWVMSCRRIASLNPQSWCNLRPNMIDFQAELVVALEWYRTSRQWYTVIYSDNMW